MLPEKNPADVQTGLVDAGSFHGSTRDGYQIFGVILDDEDSHTIHV